MSLTINTNIKNDTKNGYLADAKNVKGIYQTVKEYSDMLALPEGTIVEGSHVYVASEGILYKYTNAAWEIEYATYSAGDGITFREDPDTGTIAISYDVELSDSVKW